MHRDQNRKAHDCHTDGEDGVSEAMACFVAEVSEDHGKSKGSGPWRHAVQLRLNFAVAVAIDDAGGEVGVARRVGKKG